MTCTPYLQLLWVMYDIYTRIHYFREFRKTSIPLLETSVSSVKLWRSTRGAGMPLSEPGVPVPGRVVCQGFRVILWYAF